MSFTRLNGDMSLREDNSNFFTNMCYVTKVRLICKLIPKPDQWSVALLWKVIKINF